MNTPSPQDIILASIRTPESITVADAQSADRAFPACIVADIAALNDPNIDDAQARSLRRKISVALGSEDALRRILGSEPDEFANFYPDKRNAKHNTDSTIDSFLNKFNGGTSQAETSALEQMIFNPAPSNYFQQMEQHRDLNVNTPESAAQTVEKQVVKSSCEASALTEGFAKLMIKNGNYAKALEIIETLYLNNPEKSVYFADQIRFLRKLILNANKL